MTRGTGAGGGIAARLKRWIYRGGRPDGLAKALNAFFGRQYATGGLLARPRDVTLEIPGRTSGRPIAFPIVLADHEGEWYAVSMLGREANWVRNLRAAQGHATLHRAGTWSVRLDEVPVPERAPILRRYVQVAPGARPHIPVPRTAPLAAFADIAADYPAYRVVGYPGTGRSRTAA